MDFEHKLAAQQKRIEVAIKHQVPSPETRPSNLHSAMRYSMDAGGKRLRPILLLAAFELSPSTIDPVPAAIAIECIHTYSLIHDDLPSIDNSDLRRGKPSCHNQFNESTALLAGDALLTYAFEHLSNSYISTPEVAVNLIQILASASGSLHLIGGQMEDIEGENKNLSIEDLDFINENKTAALITAAICMGATLNGSYKKFSFEYQNMGKSLGLAFQIIDDVLDIVSDSKTLGKDVGQDSKNEKNTIPQKLGVNKAKELARKYTENAANLSKLLSKSEESSFLTQLIYNMEKRIH